MFVLLCYTRYLKKEQVVSYFNINKYFGFAINKISKILLYKGIPQLQDAIGITVKTLSCNATLFRLLLPKQKAAAYDYLK